MCCHGNLICKDKMNKRNNKILTDAVPIDKDLLKIGVWEPQVPNINDTSLSYTYFEQIIARWCYIKLFSGIDISCMFNDNRFSLISSDSAIFLLNFWFWKLLPMILKSLNATQGWLLSCVYKDVTFWVSPCQWEQHQLEFYCFFYSFYLCILDYHDNTFLTCFSCNKEYVFYSDGF